MTTLLQRSAGLLITALALLLFTGCTVAETNSVTAPTRPNILVIYTDDVGYGDVSCYGVGKIQTPRIDELAQSGRIFTSAYATAATCTPSRYSMLTGKYAFRKEGSYVLNGDAAMLMQPGELTLASHLQEAGYHTAVIGKWHLGLGDGTIDWNGEIKPGPLEIGFDHSYLMPATNDRVPCVYVDGHRVENLDPDDPITVSYGKKVGDRPTGYENPELLRYPADGQHNKTIINGISRIGFQAGGKSAEWRDEEMTDRFTERAIEYMEKRAKVDDDRPWFMYFNLIDAHVPRWPAERFHGKSGYGLRGDMMLHADWSVGELMDALDRLGIRDDTIVIFTSDNGPVLNDGYRDGSVDSNGDHTPSGPYRGGKYQSWEGGTRLPFIVSWPGHVKPGESDALISQVDLLATFAEMTGHNLPAELLPTLDTRNVLPAMLGESDTARKILLTQGHGGVSIRSGDWKFIMSGKRGNDFTLHKHGGKNNPLNSPAIKQGAYLFNLADDAGEKNNLAESKPELAEELNQTRKALMEDAHAVEVMAGD